MPLDAEKTRNIVEAALLSAGQPLSIDRLLTLFLDEYQPSRDELHQALATLTDNCAGRGVELVEVGSGFRYQARQDYAQWVARLWEEKPARYSRALLETLSLIAYRQPITRGEIEDIRGVSVSSSIMKTLLEREWVKVVGYRDVPGKPAMYASTRQFLDYFGLKSLGDLPTLAEIRDIDSINAELDLADPGSEPADEEADAVQPEAQLSLDEIVAINEAAAEQAEAEEQAAKAEAEAAAVINDAATTTLSDDADAENSDTEEASLAADDAVAETTEATDATEATTDTINTTPNNDPRDDESRLADQQNETTHG